MIMFEKGKMKSPFSYFGGKSAVASIVWKALGQPRHYMEPFFGSGAVLLSRPAYDPTVHVETICDADGFIANVWRALQFDPDEVARWCDWPVNHADLSARKKELIKNEDRLLENLITDPEWHDPKLAGYWIWAAGCWIGSGLTSIGQRPHLSDGGMGVHAIGQRSHLGDGGMGVQEPYNKNIYRWFRELSERLRNVRVVCGDWTRVCGGNWQTRTGTCGIFFDPPYSSEYRDADLYHKESMTVAHDVRCWALERADNPLYRIVIAGYREEHTELEEHGWMVHEWRAQGGYGNQANRAGKENAKRECLWLSPHCIKEKKEGFGIE